MSDGSGGAATLCVVVVNWNGRELLEDCLASLRDGGYGDLRVIVVDNASQDTSVAWLRKQHQWVEVIVSEENLRWAGGNNLALQQLEREGWPHELVLLLNNDTIVPQGSLERLTAAAAADPAVWAATPRILYADDPARAWYDGGKVGSWSGWIRHEGIRQLTGHLPADPRNVEYGTGCALLLTRQALQECGMLDTRYHFYGEDADYCLRLRRAGGTILHVPRALVLHKVSASLGAASPRKAYLRSRSHVRLLRRHWPRRRWPALVPAQIAYFGGHAVWHLWQGRLTTSLAVLDGMVDELRGRALPGAEVDRSNAPVVT